MITTSHMGLTVWDDPEDDFDHSQLAENFIAIDNHDHSAGHGKQLSAEAFGAGSITESALAEEAVGPTKIRKNSIGSEQIESEFLPLGTVISWYRLNNETPLPVGGWEVLDGREWKNVTNSMGYKTGNMPNMVGKLPKGVSSGNIGETGGSATINLAHSHAVESHSHSVPAHTHSVPAHTHSILLDGEHAHAYHGTFPSAGSYNLFQHRVGIPQGESIGEFTEAIRLANIPVQPFEREVPMLSTGAHAHSGSTGATEATTGSTSLTSGGASPATDSKLGSISTESPYVGLLFLIKCR